MSHSARAAATLRLASLLVAAAAAMPAGAQISLSTMPNLSSAATPTNLILTIDDSGSMTSAFVPDNVGDYSASAAFASSSFNGLYYDPTVVYQLPVDHTGATLTTSFTSAPIDGFNPGQGTVDLSSAYRPTRTYGPFDPSQGFANPTPAPSTTAYYYTYTGGPLCFVPVPWNPPPKDTCFTLHTITTSAADQAQATNFAIWYSFYRTRHLAIVSAASLSMNDAGMAATRVAWQGLTTCNDFTSGTCNNQNNNGTGNGTGNGRGGGAGAAGAGNGNGNNNGNGSNATVTTSVNNLLHTFTDTPVLHHKQDFYYWLFNLPASSDTPTRTAWGRAGQYFTTKGPNSPYGLDPNNGSTSTTELACVNNFQITLTDGQWNDADGNYCGGGACGNEDTPSKPVTLPDGTVYAPSPMPQPYTAIYSDTNTGGLADIAFYYWSHNLRSDLTGTINGPNGPVPQWMPDPTTNNPITGSTTDTTWPYWNPRNDPATWPHMVNFTIGVGLTGYLTLPGLPWQTDSFGGLAAGATTLNGSGYANLLSYNGTLCTDKTNVPTSPACSWPSISTTNSGSNAGNVYDLWHAAVNSRGQAFSAQSPTDLLAAMKTIITRIEGQAAGTGVAAGSSSMLSTNTTLYVGTYDSRDWHGVLGAYAIVPPTSPNAGAVAPNPTWSTLTTANSIPAVANRKVFTSMVSTPLPGVAATGAAAGNPFNATDPILTGTGSTLWPLLASQPNGTDQVNVVNYLLGDPTNEVGGSGSNLYRPRPLTKLGDIVNSSPVFSYDENFGYQVLENGTNPEPVGSYETYLSTTKTRSTRPAMVYVGANDGMLHAFNASSPADTTTGSLGIAPGASSSMGQELFAYVPHSVVPNLYQLSNPNYTHHFYVDGTPYVGDAFLGGTGGSWRTILVSATGAGAKGVFALDVTDPDKFGASNVLWDMDGSGFGNSDPDLGYTIGQPVVVRLNDGNWYAAFGNGYVSVNGCPVLYLVKLHDSSVAFGAGDVLTLRAQPTASCANNGLGSPTPLDIDGNGTTDFIYAGDLQGNLWKFDVSGTTSSNWGMAAIKGATNPGLLFTATPPGNATTLQPIVGAPTLGSGPNGVMLYFSTGHLFATGDATDLSVQSVYGIQDSGVAIGTRSNLVAQTITTAANGIDRMLSNNAVSLSGGNAGWVVDLLVGTNALGERVTQQPMLVGNVVVFVSDTPNALSCSGGGCTTFLYGINPLSGGGGMDFFSDAGAFYDAISSGGVGCLTGITVIMESGSSVLTYGFGPKFGNGGGQQNPPTTGVTGSTPGPLGQPGCTANVDCTRDHIPDATGRKSWHEMVQ